MFISLQAKYLHAYFNIIFLKKYFDTKLKIWQEYIHMHASLHLFVRIISKGYQGVSHFAYIWDTELYLLFKLK